MPFRIAIVENVVYTSWSGFTTGELGELAARIADLRRTTGRAVVYVARIPGGGPAFTADEQGVLLAYLNEILPFCATLHHVIEGDGFVKSARLATVNNFARATSRARDFVVHETLDGAFAAIRSAYGVDLRDKRTNPPPPRTERASSAFRAAARIIEGKKPRKD
jgi:hypothetical protein